LLDFSTERLFHSLSSPDFEPLFFGYPPVCSCHAYWVI
jgi:hypothetical protein